MFQKQITGDQVFSYKWTQLALIGRRWLICALVSLSALLVASPMPIAHAQVALYNNVCTYNNQNLTVVYPNVEISGAGGFVTAEDAAYPFGGPYYGMLRAGGSNSGDADHFAICATHDNSACSAFPSGTPCNLGSNWLVFQSLDSSYYVSAEQSDTGLYWAMLRGRASVIGSWEKYACTQVGQDSSYLIFDIGAEPPIESCLAGANDNWVAAEDGSAYAHQGRKLVPTGYPYTGDLYGMLRARTSGSSFSNIGAWEKFTVIPCNTGYPPFPC
jgi:hypothetical protein